MKQHRLMIAGLDNWYHAFPIAEYCNGGGRMQLVAAANENAERLAEYRDKFSVPDTDTDWRVLMDRCDCDIVMVSSVSSRHEEIVVEAAKRGKHIICDKPVALDYAAALRMQKAVEEAGVKLAMMHNYRFSPILKELKALVAADTIGRITSLTFNSRAALPEDWPGSGTPGWYAQPEYSGGGGFIDHASHVVDAVIWFYGEQLPTKAFGTLGRYLHADLPGEDGGMALLDFEGSVACVECSWTTPPNIGYSEFVQIVGERGELFANHTDRPYIDIRLSGEDARLRRVELTEPFWTDILIEVIEAFLDAVENGTPSPTPLSQGVHATKVLDAVYVSAASGKKETV